MNRRARSACRQHGLGLIELMIAMALGLLLTLSILQLFLDVTRSHDELARSAGQMENARFALQALTESLQHAGFWNGYLPEYDDLASSVPPPGYPQAFETGNPCLPFAAWASTPHYIDNLLRLPVMSFAGVPDGCSALITQLKPDSDVLLVRHAGLDSVASPESERVHFQVSGCAATARAYVLARDGFDLTAMDCSTRAEIRRYAAHFYFVRRDNVLMRAEYVGGSGSSEWQSQPLVEGVERLVVELGLDNRTADGQPLDYSLTPPRRGDGVADEFVRCPAAGCTAAQLLDAVAARVHLLVRSSTPSPGFVDAKQYRLGPLTVTPGQGERGFQRHAYASAVRLTNIAGRREAR